MCSLLPRQKRVPGSSCGTVLVSVIAKDKISGLSNLKNVSFPSLPYPQASYVISENADVFLILCIGRQEGASLSWHIERIWPICPKSPIWQLSISIMSIPQKDVWSFHDSENGTEYKNGCRILYVWITSCNFRVLPYIGKTMTFEKTVISSSFLCICACKL